MMQRQIFDFYLFLTFLRFEFSKIRSLTGVFYLKTTFLINVSFIGQVVIKIWYLINEWVSLIYIYIYI